jgi:A/G-specific adenine glycosylase
MMLQQTQVARVVPKFNAFIEHFPTIELLAAAPLSEVLIAWNGLGYNRRAIFLWQAAQQVVEQFGGKLPETTKELVTLSGVGPNTAGAILAYAYELPVVFVETNIRTVYLYHFFHDENSKISDAELQTLLEQTLDRTNPREWYWALMDYGSHLKSQIGAHLHKSTHYAKQSKFEGSLRQVRGQILKALLNGEVPTGELEKGLSLVNDQRFIKAVDGLRSDGLIVVENEVLRLTDHTTPSHNR